MNMVDDKKYMLTLKIPIDALDDIDLRSKAKEIIEKVKLSENSEVKLQEIYNSKPPRKIEI